MRRRGARGRRDEPRSGEPPACTSGDSAPDVAGSVCAPSSPRPDSGARDSRALSGEAVRSDVSPDSRDEAADELTESCPQHHTSNESWLRATLFGAFDPVPVAGVAVFRILFGLCAVKSTFRYLRVSFTKLHGTYMRGFLLDAVPQKFYGFEWVQPLPLSLTRLFFAVMVLSAVCFTVGFRYRQMSFVLACTWSWVIMMDVRRFQNHPYLMAIIMFIMAIAPAERQYSVDALLQRRRSGSARIDEQPTTPRYVVWLLHFQLLVLFSFGALVKVNEDWLRASPISTWSASMCESTFPPEMYPALWPLLPCHYEPMGYVLAYGGLLFDAVFVPMALSSSRVIHVLGMVLSVCFHAYNHMTLHIGVFPMAMLAANTLFFEPDWPERAAAAVARFERRSISPRRRRRDRSLTLREKLIWLAIILFAMSQLLIPLRHWVYRAQGPYNVAWDESGSYFSWRMMLRDKRCERVVLARDRVTNNTVRLTWNTPEDRSDPHLDVQFAHHQSVVLGRRRDLFTGPPAIHMNMTCSLNFRPFQVMVRPELDLTQIDWRKEPLEWVEPLQPLPEELKAGCPWRWNWNFAWLRGEWRDMRTELEVASMETLNVANEMSVTLPGTQPHPNTPELAV